MAKKKTTNPTNLMSYDFLPSMGANAGGGMYSQLAQLGRLQRSQPVMNQMATQALFSPITTYINKAEEQAVAGMVEYNMANPDVDDSQLFDGTEEAIGTELQNNSARFRELNRKLAYMSPNNKDYADTVTEINKINKANVELRDQNKKLLDIRNLIKSSDVSELAGYNGAARIAMYTDIQQGNKDNFSVKNGKITWNNPNEGPVKSIDIDTISSEGPAFKNKAGYNYHTQNKLKTFKLNKEGAMTPDALNSLAYTMREELGEPGVKSLIWDNQNGTNALSKNGRFYNTEPFIQQYIASAGKSISDPFIIEELKTKNTNYVLPGANKSIGDAFMDFYKGKLSNEKTFGEGYTPPEGDGDNPSGLPFKPTTAYGAYSQGNIRLTGDPLNKLSQDLLSGSIKTQEGVFNRDLKTNIWTNDKTGATMSGDEVLDVFQQGIDKYFPSSGYNLKANTHWQQFRGVEGGSNDDNNGSENTYSSEDITATIQGSNNDRQIMKKLKDKYGNKFDFDVDITDGERIRIKLKGVDGPYKSIFVDSNLSANLAEHMNKVILLSPAS